MKIKRSKDSSLRYGQKKIYVYKNTLELVVRVRPAIHTKSCHMLLEGCVLTTKEIARLSGIEEPKE